MTTATRPRPAPAPAPYLSGFCAPGRTTSSHERCPTSAGGATCSCACHREPERMPLDRALHELHQAVCGRGDTHDPICNTVRHALDRQETL